MEELRLHLRQALRTLAGRPGITALILLTLGLGIGANSAVFSLVDTVLVKPLPFAEADRLVRIGTLRGSEKGSLALREVRELREEPGLFTGVAAYIPEASYTYQGAGEPESLPAILNTVNLFSVLGARFAHGGPWPESFDRERSFGIVLSHEVWQRRFGGDPEVIGKTMVLDSSPSMAPSYTIYGVLAPGVDFPRRTDLYRSIFINPRFPNLEDRSARNVVAVARLAPGVSVESARSRVRALGEELARQYPATNRGVAFELAPLAESYVGTVRPYLLLLLGAVALVLLVACTNVANLLFTWALSRQKSLAVRSALGAGAGRIARLLLTESLLLAVAGGALGLVFAHGWLFLLTRVVRLDLPAWMTFDLDGRVLAFTFVLSVLTGLLAGLAPATRLPGALAHSLRDGGRAGGSRGQARLRRALVVAEVGLSLMLLVGAGLMVRTFVALFSTDVGFEPARLLTFRVALPWTYDEDATRHFLAQSLERLASVPGVEAVASGTHLPLSGNERPDRGTLMAEGQGEEERSRNPYVNFQIVSPGYFETLGIPVERGRALGGEDRPDAPYAAVVSRRLAEHLWPGREAVGRRIRRSDNSSERTRWLTVVGVAGDVRSEKPTEPPGHDVYLSSLQYVDGWTYFALRTGGDPMALAASAREAIRAVDPTQPVLDFAPMRQRMLETVWPQRVSGLLFGAFAVLALLLAATGIYGVLSYAVSQRTRETGLHMALGADRTQVLRGVLGEALRLTLVGMAFGLAGALALTRAFSGLVHGISPFDPLTFLAVCLVLVTVGLAAGYFPALRATRVSPMEALRRE